MTYDIFVIYFLFAPTLALTIGIVVSYPKRIVKYFLLLTFLSSLIISLYLSLFSYFMLSLNIRKINFYFLSAGDSLNFVTLLNFSSYFIAPWFVNSLGLLIDRFYPKSSRNITNEKGKIKKLNLKLTLSLLFSLFLATFILLSLSLYQSKWEFFKVFSLNIISLLPLFLITYYIRKKKKFLFITEFNISSLILSLYILISSFFISEFIYDSTSYPVGDILYTIFIYILSGEITVSLIAVFYNKLSKERRLNNPPIKKEYPVFKRVFSYEENSKEFNFPSFEDNE